MAKPEHRAKPYWLYGAHAVTAALANPRRQVKRLLATRNAAQRLEAQAVKPEIVEPQAFSRFLPEDAVHQGIAAEIMPLPDVPLETILKITPKRPLLLLDQVTDPHNVGAILRSAAAFGAAAVVVTEAHAPPEGAVLAKSASGALELIPLVRVVNLAAAIKDIHDAGWWVAGLAGEAKQTLAQAKLGQDTALVLGAEGAGLRRLTSERCDLLVRLPISPQMESLNVSNAAAVALYALNGE